ILDKQVLRQQIIDGTTQHYYYTRDEGNEGVFAMGIAGYVGGQLAALSIVGPTSRMKENFDSNVQVLLKARTEFFEL
ncbi:MAG: IclR family transcriptional regulator, partial [Advenella sp.]